MLEHRVALEVPEVDEEDQLDRHRWSWSWRKWLWIPVGVLRPHKAYYSIDDYINDDNAWPDVAQFHTDNSFWKVRVWEVAPSPLHLQLRSHKWPLRVHDWALLKNSFNSVQ